MTLLFAYPGNEKLAKSLVGRTACKPGVMKIHCFPDGENLVTLETDVRDRDILLLCSLDRADEKALNIMFFSQTAKDLGARSVGLVAPYLGYMRQVKRFHEGEALPPSIFATFISQYFDGLASVDPLLLRHQFM